MDTEKIVGDVAEVVRDLVSRTLSQAEERAQEIVDTAQKEATGILDRARSEADEIRAKAEAEAQSRLKTIQAALAEVQTKIGVAEVPASPVPEPEPEPPVVPEPTPPPPDPAPSPEPVPEPEPPLIPEPTPPPDEATIPQAAETAKAGAANGRMKDDASARLVAMNLALEGASREDARARIEAEYDCSDLDGLIDDIYARVPAQG